MSELAKKARADMRAKAERMAGPSKGAIDASGWKEPVDEGSLGKKTGPRPVSRQAYKKGGKVSGEEAREHAGRKPRKAGGGPLDATLYGDTLTNKRASGGAAVNEENGTRPTGGRIARKHGGKAGKGKMNVNIVIATGQKPGDASMPPQGGMPPRPPMPPMPPGVPASPNGVPAAPMAMPPQGPPPGAPMMGRKAGGRTTYPKMTAGGLSGEGRLEKVAAYGLKPPK